MDEARRQPEEIETTKRNEGADGMLHDGADDELMSQDAGAAARAKMKVRVVLRQEQAAAQAAAASGARAGAHYEYRADRIVLAVVSACLVIGGLSFLGYRLSGLGASGEDNRGVKRIVHEVPAVDTATRSNTEMTRQEIADKNISSNAGLSQRLSDDAGSENDMMAMATTPISATSISATSISATSIKGPANRSTSAHVESDSADSKKITLGSELETALADDADVQGQKPTSFDTSDVKRSDNPSTSPAQAAQSAQAQSIQSDMAVPVERLKVPDALSQGPQVDVFNASVVRASLNWRVTDLEPGRAITESPLIFKAGEAIKRVFFYTQLDDHKDSLFYYEWFLNDRSIARVKVGVWSDRWRSYSSKQILRKNVGDWRVVLSDAEGKVYARAQFEVRQAQ